VHARSLALKRAFVNLIANAVNYGGSATVRLVMPDNRVVVVEIEDDGPGIAPGDVDRVFEPFHRGEPSRNRETGGVGLGLPIARNIMRAHGGDVTLANRPTGGVKATVTLPV
jgi:signal transduction histidine kinase